MNTSEDRLDDEFQKISHSLVELAEENNQLTSNLISLAEKRNTMAEQRTVLSESRTDLAKERNDLALSRTGFSRYRSVLAKGRTELAFIRTGLAFVALGIGMMRYFGFGPWTILDAGIVVIGAASAIYGSSRFITTVKFQRIFERKMKDFLVPESEAMGEKS